MKGCKWLLQFFFIPLSLLVTSQAFSWGFSGHRVVAQIAYDHLTPHAAKVVTQLTREMTGPFPPRQFVTASTWPDEISIFNDVKAFNHWHYIDTPYVRDHIQGPQPSQYNVVWAILQSQAVLRSPKSNPFEKAMFLRFLVHFVGDVHQPMHCISLYSRRFPTGDAGGNFYKIRDVRFRNLHQLWDRAGGLFQLVEAKRTPLKGAALERLVRQLEKRYPRSHFQSALKVTDPTKWADESHWLAITQAYQVPEYTRPSQAYLQMVQDISAERLVLAGYRLSDILNSIY